jgi:hypothetical protein
MLNTGSWISQFGHEPRSNGVNLVHKSQWEARCTARSGAVRDIRNDHQPARPPSGCAPTLSRAGTPRVRSVVPVERHAADKDGGSQIEGHGPPPSKARMSVPASATGPI